MRMTFEATNLITSPATPAAILLYGIVFGFAMWSYLGLEWQRYHTIALYVATAVWAMVVIVRRWRAIGFALNRVDILFCAFLFWVLGSVATHWWKGNIQYLEFMPFFFILPYLLGRMMVAQDFYLFRKILIGMGGVLLLLMPLEYWINSQPGILHVNSPTPTLFGQGHAVMLSGLLLSATLLALISTVIYPIVSNADSSRANRRYRLFGYLMLAAIVSTMVWISARGSVVAAVLSVIVLFIFSPFLEWKKKAAILLYIGLFTTVTFTIAFQNEYHKEYYMRLFVSPSVALSEVPRHAPRLEYGKPILGENTCHKATNSIADRWIHYRSAWEMFLAKPLTGVGANSYGFYSCTGPGWYPHSTMLHVLAELGVLGGLLYFSLLWMVVRVPIRRCMSTVDVSLKANMGWLLAYIVLQITTSQFFGSYFISTGLYFVMGLAASFYDGAKSKRAGS